MSYLYNVTSQPVTGDISTATTVPTGTGATARSLRSHFGNVIFAADFGVLANNSTDDTAAWTNAFNAATGTQKSPPVIAPAGVSIISTITIPIGVTLKGAARNNSYPFSSVPTTLLGSILKKTSGTNGAILTSTSTVGGNDDRGTSMVDMALIGDTTHHGVTLALGIPFYFTNCTFVGCNAAIEGNTTQSGGFSTIIVDGCDFAQNTIGVWNVGDSRISNCFFASGNGNAIQFDSGAQDNTVANNKIEFNTGNGIQVDSCEDVIIANNLFDSNGASNIRWTNNRNGVISGNAFRNQSGITMASHIFLQGNTDTVIVGNATRLGGGATSPTASVNAGTGNTSVLMFGNAWRGHVSGSAVIGTTTNINGAALANVTTANPLNIAMTNLV